MKTTARRGRHQHRVKSHETHGFAVPIRQANGRNNPKAHGGVVFTDRCACGAHREQNANGVHRETGPWIEVQS